MGIRVISVHAPVLHLLRRHRWGMVLGVHSRAVSLRIGTLVVTLVAAERGNGPGALVLAPGVTPGELGWRAGDVIEIGHDRLQGSVGPPVLWKEGVPWMPSALPAWDPCTAWRGRAWLAERLRGLVSRGALLPAVLGPNGEETRSSPSGARCWDEAFRREAFRRIRALRDALMAAAAGGKVEKGAGIAVPRFPWGALESAVVALVGFGPGLTPSGDDVLAGLVCTLRRARHPLAGRLRKAILRAASGRTHPVSEHMLRWASRGVAGEAVVGLVDALLSGQVGPKVEEHLVRVTTTGAWSGPDWAAGVLLALDLLGSAEGYSKTPSGGVEAYGFGSVGGHCLGR